jgi:hypothetical protein
MDVRKAALAALCLLTTPVCADPISGYVNANGTVAIPSSLYTVLHPKQGHYSIVFTAQMLPEASCVIMPIVNLKFPLRGHALYIKALMDSDTECSFQIHMTDTHRLMDSDFSFIAMPMSN